MECNLAWSNLGRRAAPVAAAQMDLVVDEIKLSGLTELIILMAIVPVLHMVAHGLFRRFAKSLGEAQRVAAAHHLVELILGTVGTPVAFAATRRLMFCVPEETYTRDIVDAILGCSLGLCAMYASELSGRLSATRALTTVHHLLTLGLLIAIQIDTNELMVATGALFVTGALAEFPLFAGLLLYRFREGRERLAWWVLLVGLVTYAATRIIQISLHVALCVCFDLGSSSTFTLVWVVGVGFALDCVQMYTFVIYRQILRKVMPRSGSGSSACHVKGQTHTGGLALATPGGFTMSSLDRQSSFMGSLSSERSHTDDGASPVTNQSLDQSTTHECESPPESPRVRNSPLKAMRKLQRWDELGQGARELGQIQSGIGDEPSIITMLESGGDSQFAHEL